MDHAPELRPTDARDRTCGGVLSGVGVMEGGNVRRVDESRGTQSNGNECRDSIGRVTRFCAAEHHRRNPMDLVNRSGNGEGRLRGRRRPNARGQEASMQASYLDAEFVQLDLREPQLSTDSNEVAGGTPSPDSDNERKVASQPAKQPRQRSDIPGVLIAGQEN